MEILKKPVTWIVLLFNLNIGIIHLYAQDFQKLQNAFIASYSYENNKNYAKAIDALKQVYDGQSYEINVRLGWLYYYAANYPESIKFYSKAIQLKPYSVEARFGYALPASAMGNWNDVLKKYFEILEIDKNNYTANYRIGLIYYNRKDYATAYRYFEKLANMFPYEYDVTHMFAWTNYRLGKLREARVLFQKTLLIKPGDSSAAEGLKLIK
ncbi:MAG TPA: tetratricopeptide repeat protein [Bacteroidales bacterium]|nr:tetratricopeptide repeat protein [Bacteroidales bacterium]HPT01020.1 tetratricopeptide repeat protein [Bacteroidales bacterium]